MITQSEVTEAQARGLLEKAGLSADVLCLKNCGHGGNNRTYQVKTSHGFYALKKYFRGNADARDRLGSEFSFLNYAKQIAHDFVPASYCQDPENGMALYEFVEGHSIRGTIGEAELSQAAAFFCKLNDPKTKAAASHLPLASEAAFSIEKHLEMVGARVKELHSIVIQNKNSVYPDSALTLINHLTAVWEKCAAHALESAHQLNISVADELDQSQRCISPSDFGFHNALLTANNQIKFIDFEYAGWDDPARMVGDFFSQLAVPVPQQYYDGFTREVMQPFSNPAALIKRAKILRAIYQIKWCCIALNVFVPKHLERRKYANPALNVQQLYQEQMAKAEQIIRNIEGASYELC